SLRGAFSNQGEICHCTSRLLVERPVFDAFVERFVAGTKALRLGDPLEPATEQGAVVSKGHHDKILSYLALAREEGGRILCGGGPADAPNRRCSDGWFVRPTVVADLPPGCRTNQEEIFGPVVTVAPFDTEDEAIAVANGTRFGLSAVVWTGCLE